jgi:hypothetical protein
MENKIAIIPFYNNDGDHYEVYLVEVDAKNKLTRSITDCLASYKTMEEAENFARGYYWGYIEGVEEGIRVAEIMKNNLDKQK